MKKHTCLVVTAVESQANTKLSAKRHLLALLAPAAMVGALLAWAPAASAQTPTSVGQVATALAGSPAAAPAAPDEAYDALRRFAGEVGLASPKSPHAAVARQTQDATQDETYSALLDFAQMVGAEAPKTVAADGAPADAGAAKPKAAAVKPAAAPKARKPENKGGDGDPYFVGSAKCLTCHAAIAAEFQSTLMGRIGRTTRKGSFECENCHGPGSKHVAAGGGQNTGMIAYRPTDPRYAVEEINSTCLSCHDRGGRAAWKGSTHENRGLACTNCHTVMRNVSPKNLLSSGAEAEVCFQCHKDRRAQMFRPSHMPSREGKITCSDCHNAHGSVNGTEAMIREPSINDNCYKCHAEKRGPFLFEHAPVRENCDNCHEPHGTVNEALLKMSRPRLCFECHQFGHSQNQGPGAVTTMGRSCQNCHVNIHGSNSPAGAVFQR